LKGDEAGKAQTVANIINNAVTRTMATNYGLVTATQLKE